MKPPPDVVLGGHFQSIITRTKADTDECIDFLKREGVPDG